MKNGRNLLLGTLGLAGVAAAAILLFQRNSNPSAEPAPEAAAESVAAAPETAVVRETVAAYSSSRPEAAAPVPGSLQRRHEIENRGFEAAARDAGQALDDLGNLPSPVERAAFIRGIFEQTAGGDRRTALALAERLPAGTERDVALATLLDAWSGTPGSSLAGERAGNGGVAGALGRLFLEPGHSDPQLAAQVANDFLTGAARVEVLSAAAASHAASDPGGAFLFGESLAGAEQDRFIQAFATGWAASDPEAAFAWANEIEDAAFRDQIATGILASAASRDASRAAALLSALHAGPARLQSINAVAANWARQDTAAAFDWANKLSQPSERAAAQAAISQVAPVGVGVAITGGGAAYPQVAQVVPGSPAGRTGALRSNDRIVALADAQGRWIETKGMDLNQIVGLMRGTAGTPVRMRVLGANAPDLSQVRVVDITREQIFLKN